MTDTKRAAGSAKVAAIQDMARSEREAKPTTPPEPTPEDPVAAVLAEVKADQKRRKAEQPSPIEVWLTRNNIEVTCTIVHEDESTRKVDVDSLSMRGAQREITGWLISEGYVPVGRWEVETFNDREGEPAETVRKFKLANPS